MQFRLNPVLIAGYDVLYIGKKGFSSLARARKALVRQKGAAKDEPWIELDLSKVKKKVDKEKLVTNVLFKLTKRRDQEAEQVLRKEKKKAAKVPAASQIKFQLADTAAKIIKTKDDRKYEIKKYYFETPKSYEFVQARDMNAFVINTYIQAVKKEFLKEVYSKHGKAIYLIRFYHDYDGFPSTEQSDPLDKGFHGMSINRQTMTKEDAKEQFDILSETYIESFARYLQFARSDTHFRFTGFTAEVTIKEFSQEGKEIAPAFQEKEKKLAKKRAKQRKQKKQKKKKKQQKKQRKKQRKK